jgi:hypothetical protein
LGLYRSPCRKIQQGVPDAADFYFFPDIAFCEFWAAS